MVSFIIYRGFDSQRLPSEILFGDDFMQQETRLPRNFCVAFFIETLIAQPIARMAMTGLHKYQSKID